MEAEADDMMFDMEAEAEIGMFERIVHDMTSVERSLEWLRPLVETQQWDYCVLWLYGADGLWFVEFGGCCCAGCYAHNLNSKEEARKQQSSLTLCKDSYHQHPLRTKACEALAYLPSSMPLEFGIYGMVAHSSTPIWLYDTEHKSSRTKVLIPVGVCECLVELYSTKHVAEDQSIIEFVKHGYKHYIDRELMTAPSNNYMIPRELDPFPNKKLSDSHLHRPKRPNFIENSSKEPEIQTVLVQANHVVKEKNLKPRQMQRLNLVAERNRRIRINDGLFAIHTLSHKISRAHHGELVAADVFAENLEQRLNGLRDELKAMADEEFNKTIAEMNMGRLIQCNTISPFYGHDEGSSSAGENNVMEVKVEVKLIGYIHSLLEFFTKQTRRGFAKLMEDMNSLGFRVLVQNVTTINGKVFNILRVQLFLDTYVMKYSQLGMDSKPPLWAEFCQLGMDIEKEGSFMHKTIKNDFLQGMGSVGKDLDVVTIFKNQFRFLRGRAWLKAFQTFERAVARGRPSGTSNLRYAWYGNSKHEIVNIIKNGFAPCTQSKNEELYGHGVYLSPLDSPFDSALAAVQDENGLRHVLLCQVLLGNTELVQRGSIQSGPSSMDFETGVDDLLKPKKYIVWDAHRSFQICPKYLISFRAPSSMSPQRKQVNTNAVKPCTSPSSTFMKFPVVSVLSTFLPPSLVQKWFQ